MTLDDLRTIVGIMDNDCPDGRVQMVHVANSKPTGKYKTCPHSGRLIQCVTFDGTVPRNVAVAVQWHRPGKVSELVGKYRTLDSGFPQDVELEEIDGGKVAQYVRMIQWVAA